MIFHLLTNTFNNQVRLLQEIDKFVLYKNK